MTNKKLPIESIAKLADDVREIKDFAENHNFDTSLFTANLLPASSQKTKRNLALPTMIIFIFLVLCVIAIMKFWNPPLEPAMRSFIFIVGLVFIMLASISAHMRFKETMVTAIVAVGLTIVLFIGAGIFTPKEAIDKVGEYTK